MKSEAEIKDKIELLKSEIFYVQSDSTDSEILHYRAMVIALKWVLEK